MTYIKALELEDIKKGDTVEVYCLHPDYVGFIDKLIARVARVKGYIRVEFTDRYWETHTWFWTPGSHRDDPLAPTVGELIRARDRRLEEVLA